jgi:hypothetical protein
MWIFPSYDHMTLECRDDAKARFTLRVRAEKNLGPNLSVFLACCLAPSS